MDQGNLLFDRRFMPRYAGSIISDPSVAIIELVANAWDAYATEVRIQWPDVAKGLPFEIRDNGKGMTAGQFERRWGTFDYDRRQSQGEFSRPPADMTAPPRRAYGRNGKGRHAAFLFSDPYELSTWRDGHNHTYLVRMGETKPFEWELVERTDAVGHGTKITATTVVGVNMTAEKAREVLGPRFLLDPSFKVYVDNVEVTFDDVPSEFMREEIVEIEGLGAARILMIDTQRVDKTTRQHGIAWHVINRLVGGPGWKSTDFERVLDGRTSEAKRFTFIVFADFLADSVKPDWSDFEPLDAAWTLTRTQVQDRIREMIGQFAADMRSEAKAAVRQAYTAAVEALAPASRDRWNAFVDEVVEKCPGITTDQVGQVAGVLAKLETASSKYGLLAQLHDMTAGDLDVLHQLLTDWTIRTAKLALDEIQTRLRLIAELDVKLRDASADEVQDLQPLFERGLWIFGPQFESIEYTSNKGMTEVIRKAFGSAQKGSLNRPDFVIVPDGSLGLYSRDAYGGDKEVNGVASLVIAEIKKPDVTISTDEKSQAWKYVRELIEKGLINRATEVHCFVLGAKVHPSETGTRDENGGRVRIEPMSYNVFIRRAERRMLNLHAKLRDAPFLQTQGLDAEAFVHSTPPTQSELAV